MSKKMKFVTSLVMVLVLSAAVVVSGGISSKAAVKSVKVTIYSPNANADGLVKSTAVISKVTPTYILKEMSKKIPALRKVKALGFVQNKKHVDLNLSKEFQDELCKCGTAGETMLMGSVVNTMLDACKATTISIKVKGKVIETGHRVYNKPLTFYTFNNSQGVKITIYSPNANADGFIKSTATVEKVRPTLVLNELSKKVPALVNVRALGFVQNKKHVELNLSKEFQDELCKLGTAGETMLMGSVVNTMLDACKATTISIKVNGKVIETGHCIYDQPLTFFK